MRYEHACNPKYYGIRPIQHFYVKDDYCRICGFNSQYGEPYIEPFWLRLLRRLVK